NGADIPKQFTCSGEDRSPALEWNGAPAGTKSLALIVDDPDAPVGTWVHWLLWNIAPGTTAIKENDVPEGSLSGLNDFKNFAYGGPCPPSGTHPYFFKLYALDTILVLSSGAKKVEIEKALKEHVISQTHI